MGFRGRGISSSELSGTTATAELSLLLVIAGAAVGGFLEFFFLLLEIVAFLAFCDLVLMIINGVGETAEFSTNFFFLN